MSSGFLPDLPVVTLRDALEVRFVRAAAEEPVLVGRQAELERLRAALLVVRLEGRGGGGEAGIGFGRRRFRFPRRDTPGFRATRS